MAVSRDDSLLYTAVLVHSVLSRQLYQLSAECVCLKTKVSSLSTLLSFVGNVKISEIQKVKDYIAIVNLPPEIITGEFIETDRSVEFIETDRYLSKKKCQKVLSVTEEKL